VEFVKLAHETKSMIVVDESHSVGTHGPNGRGLVAKHGLTQKVHFLTLSLSKAFAGRAGLIAFPKYNENFKKYFAFESRPAIFSSAVLSHDIAWLDLALDYISSAEADTLRAKLHNTAIRIRDHLKRLGFCVDSGTEQIIAVMLGSEWNLKRLMEEMMDRGVFGAFFIPPATPTGEALLRLTINSGLDEEHIQKIIEAFENVLPLAKEMGILES